MTLTITPMPGGTGAEATGIDLRRPVSSADRERLNAALIEHVALVVRDQDLTPQQYVDAVRLFGEPMAQQFSSAFALPEQPIIQLISNLQKRRDGKPYLHGRIWHTDHTHEAKPPNYTVLYGVEVPKRGGATRIANMRRAYEALSSEEQRRLDHMKVITSRSQGRAALQASTKSEVMSKEERADIGWPHPLVRTHPVNGSKAIYFHAIKVDCIEGMTPDETRALLSDLLERTTTEAFVYRHQWRKGDLLIWDNRAALHQADFDYGPDERRILHRLILKGERPFGPAMPREERSRTE